MSKKITLVAFLFLVTMKLTNAQTLSIGPMIGGNLSTINAAPNTKGLVGLSIGGFANYSVNEHLGLNAKLLYSQLGTAYNGTDDYTRFHYLQMPITLVYFFGHEGQVLRPKVYVGPYVGSLLGANNKAGFEFNDANGQSIYNRLDVGGTVGLGFNYRIQSRTWLNVDAGYSQSFTDITKTTDNTYYNGAFSLNVGVSFPVGKN